MTNLLCCFGKSEHTYSSSSYSCLFNASPVRAHLLASMCVPLREKEIDRECVWGVSEWMSQQVFECPSLYFPLCPPPLPNDRAAAAAAKLHIWINEKLQQSVFRPGQAKKVEVVWRKKAILIFAFFASRTNERTSQLRRFDSNNNNDDINNNNSRVTWTQDVELKYFFKHSFKLYFRLFQVECNPFSRRHCRPLTSSSSVDFLRTFLPWKKTQSDHQQEE